MVRRERITVFLILSAVVIRGISGSASEPELNRGWMEVNGQGDPVTGQWRSEQLLTPFGTFEGWKVKMRPKGAHYLIHWFRPTRRVVEMTFIVKAPPPKRKGLTFGLSYGLPRHWTNEAVRLTFGGDGFLLRQDIGPWFTWRSRFRWLPFLPFPHDAWLKVRIIADPTIGAFRVWMTQEGGRERQEEKVSPLLPFLNPVPRLSCIFLYGGGSERSVAVSRPKVRIGPIPNAPKSLRVRPKGPKRLQLSWRPPETKEITAYRIYRGGKFIAKVSAAETRWTDKEVKTGRAYGYFVTAVKGERESLPSWGDAAMPLFPLPLVHPPPSLLSSYDVIVYGATPAGIAAGVIAARFGHSVALVERTGHIGGMMTGGLSATDRRYRKASGGLFLDFVRGIERFYAQAYGENSFPHRACREGYLFEPKVALYSFHRLLAETPNLHLYLWQDLGAVLRKGDRLIALLLHDRKRGLRWRLNGKIFIDATYEGDLAALSGAMYRIGREGRDDFGEPHGGEVFWDIRKMTQRLPPSKRLLFGRPEGDFKVQAYNFRLTLTKRADNRRPIPAPPDYDPNRYAEIARRVGEGILWHPMEIFSLVRLPRQKFDANNTPGPFPSSDFIGANYDYPEAEGWRREQIARAHRNYLLGLLYFLQVDERLPDWFSIASQYWGLAADEFEGNENFPPQLYVREARRIVGLYTFTENDARPSLPGRRAPIHPDSVAVAEYPIDSHACTPRDPKHPYLLEGFFYLPDITVPSHIPYRVMVPMTRWGKAFENLLVCVAVSATHIGFGTIRLEPVWMALGQAAGTAAHLASRLNVPVTKVPIDHLQRLLLEQGQVIAYFHDLPPPDDPRFAALQFFALRGFFDTYFARPDDPLTTPAARKILHRFAELLGHPLPYSFGSALPYPTQNSIARWLSSLLKLPLKEVLKGCGAMKTFRPDAPLTRGQICLWLYRLWWSLKGREKE